MIVFIFSIVIFRIIKYKFNKLNKENIGLLVIAVLIAITCKTPAIFLLFCNCFRRDFVAYNSCRDGRQNQESIV
ncbi:hypothetical protein XI25_08125 [Paenibacillus sp. DMB20]|nr:hypothetical protein XI25_08125 [Paenibacillus sp. DMB20]